MVIRRFALGLVLGSVLLVVTPVSASAQSWDYLFEDLAWPDASSVVGGPGIGGSAQSGGSGDAQGSGFYDYLFSDLSWPDAGNVVGAGSNASSGSSTEPSDGFWNYLFTDLQWPEQSLSGNGGFGSMGE